MKHRLSFIEQFTGELSSSQIARLRLHADLLERWNRVVRLVGDESREAWIRRHYYESVAAQALWCSARDDLTSTGLLDLGSGAGFPGLVLAALHPEREVALVEARERKAAFLAEAARELGLPLVRVIRAYAGPDLAAELARTVECITVRGLRLPENTVASIVDSLADSGRLIVWAGRDLEPALTAHCSIEDETWLSQSPHRRIVRLRPRRRD